MTAELTFLHLADLKRDYFSAGEAIAFLGVLERTFYRKKKQGVIPEPISVLGRSYYRKDEIARIKERGGIVLTRGRKKKA